jgi:hypothetical protein
MLYQSPSQEQGIGLDQRLKLLYPMANEEETPLPRAWSTKVISSTVPTYILLAASSKLCWGSGSVGSVSFWASGIRIR